MNEPHTCSANLIHHSTDVSFRSDHFDGGGLHTTIVRSTLVAETDGNIVSVLEQKKTCRYVLMQG